MRVLSTRPRGTRSPTSVSLMSSESRLPADPLRAASVDGPGAPWRARDPTDSSIEKKNSSKRSSLFSRSHFSPSLSHFLLGWRWERGKHKISQLRYYKIAFSDGTIIPSSFSFSIDPNPWKRRSFDYASPINIRSNIEND